MARRSISFSFGSLLNRNSLNFPVPHSTKCSQHGVHVLRTLGSLICCLWTRLSNIKFFACSTHPIYGSSTNTREFPSRILVEFHFLLICKYMYDISDRCTFFTNELWSSRIVNRALVNMCFIFGDCRRLLIMSLDCSNFFHFFGLFSNGIRSFCVYKNMSVLRIVGHNKRKFPFVVGIIIRWLARM